MADMAPYDARKARRHLNALCKHFPELVAVRTDLTLNRSKPSSFPVLALTRSNGRSQFLNLDSADAPLESTARKASKAAGIPLSDAMAVIEAGKTLAALNPRGSWCVAKEETPERRIYSAFEDRRAYERCEYALSVVDRLAELMPTVNRITFDVALMEARSKARNKEQIWLRALNDRGKECAALATSHLMAHARDALSNNQHSNRDQNMLRLDYWRRQLCVRATDISGPVDEATLEAAGEVMTLLYVAAVVLGAGEMRLKKL